MEVTENMTTMNKRKKQAIETKLRISEAALDLYKRYSSDKVKVVDICKEAGVSVGAFYHYFESKEGIIETAYDSLDEVIVTRVSEREYATYIDKVVDIFVEATRLLEDYGYFFAAGAYKVMLSDSDESTFSKNRASFRLIAETIAEGQKAGEIVTKRDPEKLSDYLMSTGRGVIFDWCLRKGNYSISKKMDNIIRFTANCLNQPDDHK